MKVLQILPTLSLGDGVSNDCRAIKRALKSRGYHTEIYAENMDHRLPANEVMSVHKLPRILKDDIVLYHLSTGTRLNDQILKLDGKKIIRYHNITPPQFFKGYSEVAYSLCQKGYEGAANIAKASKYLLADSNYNKEDMLKMGFRGDGEVAPILIPFKDYEQNANNDILSFYKHMPGTNLVFVGRLAPNKKQERLIEIYYYYKKYFDPDARLFLVGSGNGMELYEQQLRAYTKKLGLSNIYFTGHVRFDEILAYYQLADVFLCMSEHEGFCIPLVEAMYFNKPIVALNTSAVGETLGGSGILLEKYNPLETAGIINKVQDDCQLKEMVLANQKERLKVFEPDRVLEIIIRYIQKVERLK